MQGWSNPVGREPATTYWVRRAIVLAVAFALLISLITLVRGALVRKPVQAQPATPATLASQPAAAPGAATPAVPAPAGSASAPAEPAPAATPAPAKTAPTMPAVPTPAPFCDAASTRVALAGERRVATPGSQNLTIAVANGSPVACRVTVNASTIDLTVVSGPQTIWSTQHCDAWMPSTTQTLSPGQKYEWTVTWPTRLSRPGCKLSGNTLAPGVYVATATVPGAAPAKLVMELRR